MKLFFRTPLIPFVLVPLLMGEPVWAQVPVLPASDEAGGGSNLQLRVISADDSRLPVNSRSVKGFTVQVTNANGAGVPEAAVVFRLPDSGPSGVFQDGSHSAVAYTDKTGAARADGIRWSETPGVAAIRITASKGEDHAGVLVEQTLVSPGAGPVATAAAEPARSAPLPPAPAILESSVSVAAPMPSTPSISVTPLGRKSALSDSFRAEAEPSLSIVSSPGERLSSGGKRKWIILGLAIAAGAGAGLVFANRSSKSSSTATVASSISFGSPSVSVGHP